jgi:hypothetical protein
MHVFAASFTHTAYSVVQLFVISTHKANYLVQANVEALKLHELVTELCDTSNGASQV